MNLSKNKIIENGHFTGSENNVAIYGGFIDIKINNITIRTVSIPMPNFMADGYRDSVSEWSEEFEDFDGNNYIATVWSSMNGVDWELNIKPKENGLISSDEILNDIASKIQITINYIEEV